VAFNIPDISIQKRTRANISRHLWSDFFYIISHICRHKRYKEISDNRVWKLSEHDDEANWKQHIAANDGESRALSKTKQKSCSTADSKGAESITLWHIAANLWRVIRLFCFYRGQSSITHTKRSLLMRRRVFATFFGSPHQEVLRFTIYLENKNSADWNENQSKPKNGKNHLNAIFQRQ